MTLSGWVVNVYFWSWRLNGLEEFLWSFYGFAIWPILPLLQINWVKGNVVLNDGANDVFYCFCLFFNKSMHIEKHKHFRHALISCVRHVSRGET